MAEQKKQRFLVEVHLHEEKPVSEVDLAVCLKYLPLDSSKATFVVKKLPQEVETQ